MNQVLGFRFEVLVATGLLAPNTCNLTPIAPERSN